MLAFLPSVKAQTGQIGTGTATSSYLPIYSCYGYNYSQQLYTAAELTAAIGTTNTVITKIKFYVNATASNQSLYNQWVVYIGNTTKTTFASTTDWVPLNQMSQVYSGTLPNMTSGTWVELPLNAPFTWDGVSNLVVAVDENVPSYSCTQTWGVYTSTANTGIYYYNDTTNPNPASPPTASSRTSSIPRIQLESATPSACIFPTNVSISSVTSNSAVVSWTPPTPVPANGYDVYYNTTGVAPTAATVLNASNSVQTTATTTPISGLASQTTYYVWVRAKCATTGNSIWVPSPSFTTVCSAFTTLPWIENFDSMTVLGSAVLPSCWKNVTGTNAWTTANTANTTYNYARSQPNYVRIQYGNSTASQLWTPGFVLNAGTTYEYSFYYNTNGTTSSYVGYTGNVLVNTSQSTTGATTLGAFITATQGTTDYVQYKVYFTPTASGTYYFGENVSSTFSPWYLGLDDFKLRVAPTCLDPQNFAVTNVTLTSATVQWTVPNPAPTGGYDIYYTTSNTIPAPTAVPQYPGVAGPSQVISGLATSTTYYIWIRARCSATNIGDWTGPVKVYTNYCVPTGGTSSTNYYLNTITTTTGFTNLAYTATAYQAYVNNSATTFSVLPGNNINFSMNAGTSTFYYYIWIDWNKDMVFDPTTEQAYFSNGYINTATGTIASATRPSGQYRARFAASYIDTLTPCGNAADGNYVDFTFEIKPCATTAPTNQNMTNITHNSAQINWTQALNNLQYKVYWKRVTDTTWNSSIVLNPPTVNYVLTGLDPATKYEAKVVALCNSNEGTATSVLFTTRCDPTPPNVVVSNVTSTSATVTYNPIVPSATYVIRYRVVGTTTWINVTAPAPPANTVVISGLSSYVTYEVQVANICNGETTINQWSNPQVFTTIRVCEVPPPGLTITQLNPTSAEVTWDAYTGTGATGTYILRYRKVGIPSWTTVNVSTNTYTITGLLELTKYEMQVANVCTGTPGNFTPLYYFTTPTVTYCPMSSGSATSEYISKVTVTPISGTAMVNSSVGSTYTDYTANPLTHITLVQGSQGNVVKVDKNSASGSATGVAVWIDFNRNGYFDVNEKVLSDGPNTASTASAAFTVPTDAFVSLTDYKYVTMRVALQKGSVPVNCTSFNDGEVEDYQVRIVKQAVVNPLNQNEITIYPNPVKTDLYITNLYTSNLFANPAKYKIYTAAGQMVAEGKLPIDDKDARLFKLKVTNLTNGLYIINIDGFDKNKAAVQKQFKFMKE